MGRTLETCVLIVGAGPVGLALAMDLAWRGIDAIVIELRDEREPPRIRSNHVSARSMEIFRRLGVAGKVREAGLPADYPNDVSFRTTVTGIELARIPIPSRATRFAARDGLDTWWPTPEPPHRVNQIFLEPVLRAHAAAMPRVRMLHSCRLEDFVQNDSGVIATVRDLATGNAFSVESAYLVGCDGGRSIVRKKIGARLNGTSVIQRVQSTYIRAPSLLQLVGGPAWIYHSLNPRRCGTVFAIDGREAWLVHNHLYDDDPNSIDRDWAIRTILGVGSDFCYKVISNEDWVGRRLLADRFRDRRAFICGDAAHLWIPYAGYGMNAGIADAADLSWLLAAVLNGWASPAILDAYEAERRPITEQVSHFAMNLAVSNIALRTAIPVEIEMPGEAGDAVRARVGKQFYDLNVQQYCAGGLNFGYFYNASPIIAYDGVTQPAYTMAQFTPSSVPGCRAPHIWLDGRRSLYDALGPEYTLLRFDPVPRISGLIDAAAQRRVPLAVLDIAMPDAVATYGQHKLVLVRPDQHVAWRGDEEPIACADLMDHLRGASRAPAAPAHKRMTATETDFPAGGHMTNLKLHHRRQFLHLAAGAAALPAVSRVAWAQAYPSRPVRYVVSAPPGGAQDIFARLMGQRLSERLGQPFVIDNRPGGGTNIATEMVARASADGYTLLSVVPAAAINATLYDKLNFNFIRDIAPIAGIIRAPLVMVVNPSLPAKTVPEFIAYAKANSATINFASPGTGTAPHVGGELFKMMTGVNMLHVPYRGDAPALTDLLGGQIQMFFSNLPGSIEHIRAGKLRALAVTTAVRWEGLPTLPTLAEFVPGFEASLWLGLGAPKNTPAEIVDKLNKEINLALADPTIKARLLELGGAVLLGSPAEFGKLTTEETEKWAKVVKLSGAKAE